MLNWATRPAGRFGSASRCGHPLLAKSGLERLWFFVAEARHGSLSISQNYKILCGELYCANQSRQTGISTIDASPSGNLRPTAPEGNGDRFPRHRVPLRNTS